MSIGAMMREEFIAKCSTEKLKEVYKKLKERDEWLWKQRSQCGSMTEWDCQYGWEEVRTAVERDEVFAELLRRGDLPG